MLRIFGPFKDETTATLKAEGRIVGGWVDLLERAALGALADGFHAIIDVRDVSFADAAGIVMLRRLARTGVRLVDPSPYVAALLDEDGP